VSAKSRSKAARAERSAANAAAHLATLREYARRGNLDAIEGLRRRIEGRRVAAVKLRAFRAGTEHDVTH
jgi:hypothetical protein